MWCVGCADGLHNRLLMRVKSFADNLRWILYEPYSDVIFDHIIKHNTTILCFL